jgi:hypothetical protein
MLNVLRRSMLSALELQKLGQCVIPKLHGTFRRPRFIRSFMGFTNMWNARLSSDASAGSTSTSHPSTRHSYRHDGIRRLELFRKPSL